MGVRLDAACFTSAFPAREKNRRYHFLHGRAKEIFLGAWNSWTWQEKRLCSWPLNRGTHILEGRATARCANTGVLVIEQRKRNCIKTDEALVIDFQTS